MARALPPHWVSGLMRYEQSGKRLGIAGFYFFMVMGVLWLISLSFVNGFGSSF